MKYFDEFITEDEIDEIVKCDNLYSVDVISLYDKKNRKLLDSYVYQKYLQALKESNTNNKKGGVPSE